MTAMRHYASVDAYIAAQPAGVQVQLQQLRAAIKKAAPGAAEAISYAMPAYKYQGRPLVYFGVAKTHIGFYALPAAIVTFRDELSLYNCSKGTIRFPLDKSLPLNLIKKLVAFRVMECDEAAALKKASVKQRSHKKTGNRS